MLGSTVRRCPACAQPVTYEAIVDGYCKSDFGEYLLKLQQVCGLQELARRTHGRRQGGLGAIATPQESKIDRSKSKKVK